MAFALVVISDLLDDGEQHPKRLLGVVRYSLCLVWTLEQHA